MRTLLAKVDVRRRAKLRAAVCQARAAAPLPFVAPSAHCGAVADIERVAGAHIGAKALGALLAVLGEPRLLPRALLRPAAASEPAQTQGSSAVCEHDAFWMAKSTPTPWVGDQGGLSVEKNMFRSALTSAQGLSRLNAKAPQAPSVCLHQLLTEVTKLLPEVTRVCSPL